MSAAIKLTPYSEFEKLISPELKNINYNKKVFVTDNQSSKEVLASITDHGFDHVCQGSNPLFATDLNTSALILKDQSIFLKNPTEAILQPIELMHDKKGQSVVFSESFNIHSQKSGLLDRVENRLLNLKINSTIRSDIRLIADELFTNAIYHAPYAGLGIDRIQIQNEFSEKLRRPPELSTIFIGKNSDTIVIGCEDKYGSLDNQKLIRQIKKCEYENPGECIIMDERYGAGIGSYMIFNLSMSYYSIVNKNKCTIICCTLPITVSNRARQIFSKNIHLNTITTK
jgi:hypothetical protein